MKQNILFFAKIHTVFELDFEENNPFNWGPKNSTEFINDFQNVFFNKETILKSIYVQINSEKTFIILIDDNSNILVFNCYIKGKQPQIFINGCEKEYDWDSILLEENSLVSLLYVLYNHFF